MQITTSRHQVRQTGNERLREWPLGNRPPLSSHILVASALLFVTASAQALQPEVLYAFQLGPRNPASGLIQGSDGNLYGTTASGGNSEMGTVFQITTNGVLTTLLSFTGTNGDIPNGLVLGSDGSFYGTTAHGGSSGFGTVFKVTMNGVLTTLASFAGTNGASPNGGLLLDKDGNVLGTTSGDGSSGQGTVFKLTTNGVLTTLVSFDCENGAYPRVGLVQGNDGDFYGTTSGQRFFRVIQPGTVFKMTPNGVLNTLISFSGTNGERPAGRLVLGRNGSFYGTTAFGGSGGAGTVFKVTTNGALTVLVSFAGTNGVAPNGLVLGGDGMFYGTTTWGGSNDYGTVFQVTANGMLTLLASFANTNGAHPQAGLVVGPDGNLYGTTAEGGPAGGGTIFRLAISPKFTSVARQLGGVMLLTGTGLPNEGYRLWATTDLAFPFASWTLLTSASFDSNGSFSYTDADALTNSSRFFQLSVP